MTWLLIKTSYFTEHVLHTIFSVVFVDHFVWEFSINCPFENNNNNIILGYSGYMYLYNVYNI